MRKVLKSSWPKLFFKYPLIVFSTFFHLLAIVGPEFTNLPPSQIVPALSDQGLYVASESSFYRLLRETDQLAHRGKAKPPTRKRRAPLQAPNQLWS